jgi:hypothetical protein
MQRMARSPGIGFRRRTNTPAAICAHDDGAVNVYSNRLKAQGFRTPPGHFSSSVGPAAGAAKLVDTSRPAWGLVLEGFRPRSRAFCRGSSPSCLYASHRFRPNCRSSANAGCTCRVWLTRCAYSTGLVLFRFILICLCLPESRGRIGVTVVASPCQRPVTWAVFSPVGW